MIEIIRVLYRCKVVGKVLFGQLKLLFYRLTDRLEEELLETDRPLVARMRQLHSEFNVVDLGDERFHIGRSIDTCVHDVQKGHQGGRRWFIAHYEVKRAESVPEK